MVKGTMWEVGPGGLVARERIVAVGRWSSAPIQRAARQARREGRLIDLTYGHACHSVLFLDSGHVVLAAQEVPAGAQEPPDGQRKSDLFVELRG